MNPSVSRSSRAAFTVVDLLMVLGMVAVIVGLLLPRLPRRNGPNRISCVNNLKNIGLAFRTFAVDYNGKYPWAVDGIVFSSKDRPARDKMSGDLMAIFGSVSNELSTPKIIMCPSDARKLLPTNTWAYAGTHKAEADFVPSYFIGLDSNEESPKSILSGDRNLYAGGPPEFDWRKVTATTPTWFWKTSEPAALRALQWTPETIHMGAGNLLFGDGSVQQLSSLQLRPVVKDALAETRNMEMLMPVNE